MQSSVTLWQAVLGEIELSVSRGNFMTWFKQTQLLKYDDDVAVIGVPNVFIKQQLERKYNDLIVETLRKNGLEPAGLEFKIHTMASRRPEGEDSGGLIAGRTAPAQEQFVPSPASPMAVTSAGAKAGSHTYRQGLNDRYTFENFIVGSGNELAYAACQAIAALPGTK